MKKPLLFLIIIGISINLSAQQPENAGFEEWEMAGFQNEFEEPVNWSSLKSSEPDNLANVSPEVMFKSTDAHTGSFSVHLISKSVFSIVANGIITNGRIHADLDPTQGLTYTDPDDSRWNTPFTERPDSLVGYYKYISVDGDAAQLQALLHTGFASQPQADSSNWIALAKANLAAENVTSWTRFSIPFEYFLDINPEFILFNFSSGAGLDAVAGSEVWLDDIELIYNVVGIDEVSAEKLLNAYGTEQTIVADLSRFDMGIRFELSIYDLTGKLVKNQTLESGNKYKINSFKPGLYICSFNSSDGLAITKKVVVR